MHAPLFWPVYKKNVLKHKVNATTTTPRYKSSSAPNKEATDPNPNASDSSTKKPTTGYKEPKFIPRE